MPSGFNPRLSRILQPVVQVLASFPANFVFPFATLLFLRLGISFNRGSILLMALGAQCYLLFNIIGGAQSIPNDLREMVTSMGLRRIKVWRMLIGPGAFASWVTGVITASEGAYIAETTAKGNWPRIVLGVGLMSLFVVGFNKLVWGRLY